MVVHVAQRFHHFDARFGGILQIGFEPRRAAVEQLARRGVARLHRVVLLVGVGAEDVEHEALHGLGAARLLARDVGLLLRHACLFGGACGLPQGRTGAGHDGQRDGRRRAHHHAMAPDELARAVGAAVGPRQHGLAVEVTLQVLRKSLDSGVALRCFLAQGMVQDGVDVAGELLAQLRVCRGVAGQRHFSMGDGFFELGRAAALQLVGPRAAEQFVGHHGQAVDVAGRAQRFAADLLGARVVQGQRAPRQLGQGGGRRAVVGHQLGDAEVEQAHFASRRDEDVAGLEVAVHHELRVRVRHGLGHLQQQADAIAQGQGALLAVDIDGLTVDVFHGEVGAAMLIDTGVVQPRNVRMRERGQDVAFAAQPLGERAAPGHARQLERDLPRELSVDALGKPDGTHAALA